MLVVPDEEITCAKASRVAPMASSERTKRSSDTDGSPVSILATRDWLDLSSLARSVWVSCRCLIPLCEDPTAKCPAVGHQYLVTLPLQRMQSLAETSQPELGLCLLAVS